MPNPDPEIDHLRKLREAINAGSGLLAANQLTKQDTLKWLVGIRASIRQVFGDKGEIIEQINIWLREFQATPSYPQAAFAKKLSWLRSLSNLLDQIGDEVAESHRSLIPQTKEVFVIHGHDEPNLNRLRLLLRDDFDLTPVVILDKAGKSQTTIDKFEAFAKRCGYAIALFTPDDMIASGNIEQYKQARPNVIFETGWFVGRLGKERVLILFREGTKIHSDFDGVNRIEFKEDIGDKFRQMKSELEAAGMV